MKLPVVYARYEPPDDPRLQDLNYNHDHAHMDVAIYRDAEAKEQWVRFPWSFFVTKPDFGAHFVTIGGQTYPARWLETLPFPAEGSQSPAAA